MSAGSSAVTAVTAVTTVSMNHPCSTSSMKLYNTRIQEATFCAA